MNGHRPLPGTETGLQSTGPLAAHRAAGHFVPENPEFKSGPLWVPESRRRVGGFFLDFGSAERSHLWNL
jgi:hypothetical protein